MIDQSKERVKLSSHHREILFETLARRELTFSNIAETLSVSERTVREWRKGTYTIPLGAFETLAEYAGKSPDDYAPETIPQWWHTSSAGKSGGRVYMAKYGSLGTPVSRRVGGKNSYLARNREVQSVYTRKAIQKPPLSSELAEFIGVLIGDGSIGRYQITVTLDMKTDVEYAQYVCNLASQLFSLQATTKLRESHGCIVLTLSSVELSEYLFSLGLPRGNKIVQHISIPQWILDNPEYIKPCLRGIFDTDGSVFQEVHKVRGVRYAYSRAAFVSASIPLLEDVAKSLHLLGIAAKVRSKRVSIERFTDIDKYFRIVGSSNPKHLRRFVEYGGVG